MQCTSNVANRYSMYTIYSITCGAETINWFFFRYCRYCCLLSLLWTWAPPTHHTDITWKKRKRERERWTCGMERRRVYNSNFYTQRQLCKCIQLLLISHFRAHWVSECYRLVGRVSSWTHYCVCLCFTSSSFNILRLLLVADFFSIIFARVQNCIVWCFIFQFIASHFNNLFHRHNNSGYASLCTHSCECECVFDAFNSLFVVGVIQTILLMLHRAHRIWLPCLLFHIDTKEEWAKHTRTSFSLPLSRLNARTKEIQTPL